MCSKFAYEDIKEVHKRRYLLQPIALELFSLDGRNSLVVFPRHLRNKVYSRFLSVAVHITDNAADSLMGQKRSANVETGGLLSNFIGETSVTQRWVVSAKFKGFFVFEIIIFFLPFFSAAKSLTFST